MDDEKKEKNFRLASYISFIVFVAAIAYLIFAFLEGLPPYSIVGYSELYIQLTNVPLFYALYWLCVISLALGVYFSYYKRDYIKELLIFIILLGFSLFVIIVVGGTIPAI